MGASVSSKSRTERLSQKKLMKKRRISLEEAVSKCNEALAGLDTGGDDDDGWGSEDSEKNVTGNREFLTLKQRKTLGIAEYEPLMNLNDDEMNDKKKKKKEKPKWKPPSGGVQVMMLPPKLHHKKRKKKSSGEKIVNAPGIEPMDCTRRVLELDEKRRWRTVSLGSEGGQAYVFLLVFQCTSLSQAAHTPQNTRGRFVLSTQRYRRNEMDRTIKRR